MKAFDSFINSISPTDRVAVIHHTDCDGICSGFIVKESLKRLGKKVILTDSKAVSALTAGLCRKLRPKEITKTIFVDLVADQMPELIKEIKTFSDVLIIDHHKPNISHDNVIKQDYLGIDYYYPASKLAYDLFSYLVDISDLDWISAVGLVGDAGYQEIYPKSKQFVDEVIKKYEIISKKDIFDTEIGQVANSLTYAGDVVPHRINLAMRVLSNSKKPKDVLDSELRKIAKRVKREIDRQIINFKNNAEKHGDLLFYEMKSQYHIRGTIITRLSFSAYTNKTLIIAEREGDKYMVSSRRQDGKVNISDLMSSLVIGLEGANGGGHDKAGGAVVKAKDFDKFKERLFRNNY